MSYDGIRRVTQALPTILAFALAGCSFRGPANGSLEIVLERESPPSPFSALLSPSWLTSPTTLDDFTCFSVNVTGTGVLPTGYSPQSQGCTSSDGYRGRGIGVASVPTPVGVPVKLLAPSGAKRVIDVYGIFPPSPECGGSPVSPPEGYFLGSTVADLFLANNSVTVPISFTSGTLSTFSCSGSSTFQVFTMFPYGGNTAGGFNINIPGGGFQAGASVKIGGQVCGVVSTAPNLITCTVPGLPSGSHPVVVTNGDGATLTVGFNYTVINSGPFLSVDQNTNGVNFGSALAGSGNRVIRFTFANTGTTAASGGPTYPNADFTPLSFPGGAQCGATLAPAQTCYVDITFSPAVIGNRGGGASLFGLPMTFLATGL